MLGSNMDGNASAQMFRLHLTPLWTKNSVTRSAVEIRTWYAVGRGELMFSRQVSWIILIAWTIEIPTSKKNCETALMSQFWSVIPEMGESWGRSCLKICLVHSLTSRFHCLSECCHNYDIINMKAFTHTYDTYGTPGFGLRPPHLPIFGTFSQIKALLVFHYI